MDRDNRIRDGIRHRDNTNLGAKEIPVMRKIFRRKPKPRKPTLEEIITNAINDLARTVFQVRHDVKRTIPIPRRATIYFTRGDGQRFYLGSSDLSYKNVIPIQFPVAWITGRYQDISLPNATLEMILEYDPKDR